MEGTGGAFARAPRPLFPGGRRPRGPPPLRVPPLPLTERHDALYVVGSLDETLELRGMRYHPVDIETSVVRAHRTIAEW